MYDMLYAIACCKEMKRKKALTWWRSDIPPSGASYTNKIDDISFSKAGLSRSQRGVVSQYDVTASQWLRV
jgi:hypothetical protein